jgi:starch synthase
MPSKYEPCGLNQIYSLKYGTIPIVTPVGGLYDTVQDLSEDLSEGTGIVLKSISSEGLMSGINKAISIFNDKTKLTDIRIRIMDEDFSWKISAKRYVGIYETITTS